jgi:hypothetical protein
MNIDAAIAGVIYGSLIGVVSWLITTLLKRLSWPVWILNTLLITFVSLLLFVIETPFQIAAGIEWLEITNPGHFGSNFIFVFLVTVVIWIVVGVLIQFHVHLTCLQHTVV